MKLTILLSLIFFTGIAQAGEQEGIITSILVRQQDGLQYFTMTGTPTNKPACATHAYWMIKDENSVTGKSQLALLTSAYMAKRTVHVFGLGTCTRWGDGEDVNTIQLK